jgi:hypothetical protein
MSVWTLALLGIGVFLLVYTTFLLALVLVRRR